MKTITMGILTVFLTAGVLWSTDLTVEDLSAAGLQRVREGTAILDFELEDLEGNRVKLSDFEGKVVFLNFWATWCGPCRSEMPSMQTLHDQLKSKGLHMLAVDVGEGPEAVRHFVDEFGLTFQVLLDRDGRIGATYGVRGIPTTYVITRDGMILAGRVGAQ